MFAQLRFSSFPFSDEPYQMKFWAHVVATFKDIQFSIVFYCLRRRMSSFIIMITFSEDVTTGKVSMLK